ncbi:MAG: hypothetical protein WC477_04280 [Patescibacteria group bacterium]
MKFEQSAARNLPVEETSIPKRRKQVKIVDLPPEDLIPVKDISPDELTPVVDTKKKPVWSARQAYAGRGHEKLAQENLVPDTEGLVDLSDDLIEEPEDVTNEAVAELGDSEFTDLDQEARRRRVARNEFAEFGHAQKEGSEQSIPNVQRAQKKFEESFRKTKNPKVRVERQREAGSALAELEASDRAHDLGKKQGEERESIREAKYAEELETDADGNVIGLKNIQEVTIGAFYRGMAPAMRKITAETNWANENLSGSARTRRLKQLADEARRWERMFGFAQIAEEGLGQRQDEAYVPNPFYSNIEAIRSGLDKEMVEDVIAMSPEQLNEQVGVLTEEVKAYDSVINEVQEAFHGVYEKWHNANAYTEFNAGIVSIIERENEALQASKKSIHEELIVISFQKDPSKLDIFGMHLQQKIAHARSMQESIRKFMTEEPDHASKMKERIELYEGKEEDATGKLTEWGEDESRTIAMAERAETLHHREEELLRKQKEVEGLIKQNESKIGAYRKQSEEVKSKYATETGGQEVLGTYIQQLIDHNRFLNEKRSEVQGNLDALYEAWAAIHTVDVDMSEVEAIDVDMSDVDASAEEEAPQVLKKAA